MEVCWGQADGTSGGNKVPVLGKERDNTVGVNVGWEEILRLCMIIRILTLVVTMELVATGFIAMVCDVFQWSQGNQAQVTLMTRDRVVYGTTSDGGVDVVGQEINDSSVSTVDLNEDVFGDEGMDSSASGEGESSQINRIHNELCNEPEQSELARDLEQE